MDGKKMVLILLGLFFLTMPGLAISGDNASCRIVESQENKNLECGDGYLKFYGKPAKIELIESPLPYGSGMFIQMQNEINEKITNQSEAFSIRPKIAGKYVFRVDETYIATVFYGENLISLEQGRLLSSLTPIVIGIALSIVGCILAIRKKGLLGAVLIIGGIVVMLVGLGVVFS